MCASTSVSSPEIPKSERFSLPVLACNADFKPRNTLHPEESDSNAEKDSEVHAVIDI
jgi:hypothetical protein